jgi:translation initiation factor 2 beta subunit (eIF-2beta)/eIF-5
MINIDRSDDIFYRYKMSPLIIRQQGRNGQLILVNIDEIAKQLSVDSIKLVKFISYELGTKSGNTNNQWWIKAEQPTVSILQEIISKFIDNFILCKQCGNPETTISNHLTMKCASCGHRVKLVRPEDNGSVDKILKMYKK